MKKVKKEIKKTGKSKVLTFVALALVVGFLVSMVAMNTNHFGMLTTYIGGNITLIERISNTFTKIITGETNSASPALFDVNLNIPEKYKFIKPGENISIIVQLINFGETANDSVLTNASVSTNASISYIVTNSIGDIVFIEHEKRVVETQMSYLKTLDLPYLENGDYKILVELLYSDKSATANGEFSVV